eukprot:702476-Amphidinium_carterae.2
MRKSSSDTGSGKNTANLCSGPLCFSHAPLEARCNCWQMPLKHGSARCSSSDCQPHGVPHP